MINLISKINDRNIQRKRESGVTGYVLISALILCLYKLFNHSEFLLNDSVYAEENVNKSIELICYTFNVLFSSGSIIYLLYPNLKTLNHIKFIKRNKTEGHIFLSMVISFSIGTFLIVYTFFSKENPQYGFNFYCGLILILNLFGWMTLYKSLKDEKIKPFRINSEPQEFKSLISYTIILTSIIVAAISINFIYNIDVYYKSVIIKITAFTYLSYVIVEKMLEVNSNDLFYSKLEAFEYEIRLRKIDDNELIRKEFQERFSGFLVNEWIDNQIKLAEYRFLAFKENIDNIDSQIVEINNKKFIDKDLENKLKDEKEFHLSSYKRACLNQKIEIEKVLENNESEFELFEKEQLKNLLTRLKNEL